jgi:hypothetical protein
MIHFLSDAELDLTLQRISNRLNKGDPLIIRSPIKPAGSASLKMKMYCLYARWNGTFITFRSDQQIIQKMTNAGFQMQASQISGKNPELFWFIAQKR